MSRHKSVGPGPGFWLVVAVVIIVLGMLFVTCGVDALLKGM